MNKFFVLTPFVGLVWAQNECIAANESKFYDYSIILRCPSRRGHVIMLPLWTVVAATKLGNDRVVKPRVAGQKQQ